MSAGNISKDSLETKSYFRFSFKMKLAVLTSIIWIVSSIAGFNNSTYYHRFDLSGFIVLGVLPLIFLWGMYWLFSDYIVKRYQPIYKNVITWNIATSCNLRDRFLARFTDLLFFNGLSAIILSRIATEIEFGGKLVAFSMLGFLLNTLAISLFYLILKTTPGKSLFGIIMLDYSGRQLSPFRFFKRELKVLIHGFAFGIPLLSLFSMYSAFKAIQTNRQLIWDSEVDIIQLGPRFKTSLGNSLLVISVFIFFGWNSFQIHSQQQALAQIKLIGNSVEQISRQINRNVPIQVNKSITLNYVIAENNNVLHFYYSLPNITKEELPSWKIDVYLSNFSEAQACSLATIPKDLKNYISFSSTFRDRNNAEIESFSLSANSCN